MILSIKFWCYFTVILSLAKEIYEGTVRMLLEYGATVHEHMKFLEESKLLVSTFFLKLNLNLNSISNFHPIKVG